MTNEDGRNVEPSGTPEDQKADAPRVVDPAAKPHQIDRAVRPPDQYESYERFLYRVRAHRTTADIAMRPKKAGDDEPGGGLNHP